MKQIFLPVADNNAKNLISKTIEWALIKSKKAKYYNDTDALLYLSQLSEMMIDDYETYQEFLRFLAASS